MFHHEIHRPSVFRALLLLLFLSFFTTNAFASLAPTLDCSVDPDDCLVEFWGHVPHTWDDGNPQTDDRIRLRGRLVSPAGNGPFPAVIVLHGSGGMWHETPEEDGPIGDMYSQFDDWATLLTQNGYVALILDSFSARAAGHPPVLPDNPSGFKQLLPPEDADVAPVYERSRDAFDGLTFLRTLPEVDGDRIGLLGFSHGGGGVAGALVDGPAARAVIQPFTVSSSASPNPGPHVVPDPADPPGGSGFDCGVAYYPGALFFSYFGSSAADQGFYRPTVPFRMIYGDQDSLWTGGHPTALQAKAVWNGAGPLTGNELSLSTYAGAGHSFDNSGTQEATDARNETLTFFAGCLSGAQIEGQVWADLNGDGIQDPGEPGLESVTLDLTGTETGNTVSGADGDYNLSGLEAGGYTLHFTTPTDYLPVTGNDSSIDGNGDVALNLAANQTLSGIHTAFQPLGFADLSGTVWSDDGDGVFTGGEPGIPNLTVRLETALGTTVATTVTDSGGAYAFANLLPGTYRLRIEAERWQAIAGPDSLLVDSTTSPTFAAGANDILTAHAALEPRCEDFALIPWGASWRYLIDADAAAGWQQVGFGDGAWDEGNGLLGNSNSTVLTSLPTSSRVTRYFRHEFQLADASWIQDLTLGIERDDGAIVYLNGVEVLRSNLPQGTIDSTTRAIDPSWAIETHPIASNLLQSGTNVIAVELHQRYISNTPDYAFDLELRGTACEPCHVGAVEVPVLADTYLQEDSATSVRGERDNLWIKGAGGARRNALLSFEKPLWSNGDTLLGAELVFEVLGDSSAYHRVHEMLTDWQELAATWNDSGTTPWSGAESGSHHGTETLGIAHTELGPGTYRLGLNADGLTRLLTWLEGGTNHQGFLILGHDGTTDSLEIVSKEGGTPARLRLVYGDSSCTP